MERRAQTFARAVDRAIANGDEALASDASVAVATGGHNQVPAHATVVYNGRTLAAGDEIQGRVEQRAVRTSEGPSSRSRSRTGRCTGSRCGSCCSSSPPPSWRSSRASRWP
ncbi:hypothetical protein [Luteimicrobium album]|uniref:hypothetical protein n=1 Tax=Luteimicrobium album TaxID=1054550 RepID=UPI0032B022BC